MNITLQTFGAFRQFGRKIELTLNDNAVVADLRAPLTHALASHTAKFDIAALVESSRFATETAILEEGASLSDNSLITILPPVSGG